MLCASPGKRTCDESSCACEERRQAAVAGSFRMLLVLAFQFRANDWAPLLKISVLYLGKKKEPDWQGA